MTIHGSQVSNLTSLNNSKHKKSCLFFLIFYMLNHSKNRLIIKIMHTKGGKDKLISYKLKINK